MDPAPFLRGNPFPGTRSVPYPRAKPGDARIPGDTWAMASVPAGVRLELTGEATEIEIAYEAGSNDGWQRPAFESWSDNTMLSVADAVEGAGTIRLASARRLTVYLPERMRPRIVSVDAIGGSIAPAAARPRWICYGDSIAEGWSASMPSRAWPSIVAREHGLDLVNMGYAGAARGELASAEQIAEMDAAVISITYGTNCWSRVPFTTGLMRETLDAFLSVVRSSHPRTPILVQSMLIRPEGEDKPNAAGATHAELRAAMEDVARARGDVTLVEGLALIDESMLADEVHPNDDGHRAIASTLGPILKGMPS